MKPSISSRYAVSLGKHVIFKFSARKSAMWADGDSAGCGEKIREANGHDARNDERLAGFRRTARRIFVRIQASPFKNRRARKVSGWSQGAKRRIAPEVQTAWNGTFLPVKIKNLFFQANSSQSQNSSIIVDIHKAVSLINCYRMDDTGVSDDASGDYDKLLNLVDQYIASVWIFLLSIL